MHGTNVKNKSVLESLFIAGICRNYIVFGSMLIAEYGAWIEWYWQGNVEVLGETPRPVPLCPPQIPHFMDWYRA